MAIHTAITAAPARATPPFQLQLQPGDQPQIVALLRTIAGQPRPTIEAAVEILVELLDTLDGDPDLEEMDVEDSFAFSMWALDECTGPGCLISDNDLEHDGREREDGADEAVGGRACDDPRSNEA